MVDDLWIPLALRVQQFVAGDQQDRFDSGLGFLSQQPLEGGAGTVSVPQGTEKKRLAGGAAVAYKIFWEPVE